MPVTRIPRVAAAAVLAVVAGCATPPPPPGTGGTVADGRQTVRVEAATWEYWQAFPPKRAELNFLPGTKCTIRNDRDTREFVTPADVTVELSNAPLTLRCARDGYHDKSLELRCVTPRSEATKSGALAGMTLLNPGPAAAPLFVGAGPAGLVLYFAAAAALGATIANASVGPDPDICRYSLTGTIQIVMTASAAATKAAEPIAPKAAEEPENFDPATSSPASLIDILSSGRGTIAYLETAPGGRTTVFRATLRPSKEVLIALPRGYALNMNREIVAQAGVSYSPPIPIIGSSMAPGSKWTYSGTLRETGGVATGAVTSSFEVIGKEELATGAGSFTAIHVREIRWQGRSGYKVDRWVDEWALIPVREVWASHGSPWTGGHGTGSFSHFDPPAIEGTIEIRFLAGAS